MLKKYWKPLVLIFVITIIRCTVSTSPTADSGGGSGVGNGMIAVGRVIYEDSTPVIGATVRVRPQNFIADTSGKLALSGDGIETVVTDSVGKFFIDSLDSNFSYSVEISESDGLGTLVKFNSTTEDTIKLPTRIVSNMPNLIGTIISGLPTNSYVLIQGLERVAKTDKSGSFIIKELPVGECEHNNECEYKITVLIPNSDGTYHTEYGEFEIETKNSGEIEIEVELGDDD